MSKERLDDIVDGLLNNRLELTSFVSESLEQAERVQELEEKLKDRDSAISTGIHVSNLMKKQNKRYREALEFYALGRHWITSLKDGRDYVNEYGERARKALECEE